MTPQLPRIFAWQVVRDVRRHPGLALLNVLSVALGIAVYLAIQIANGSASRSFAATVDLVAGKAHLEVRGEVDDALWPELAKQPGVAAATALVEAVVTLPELPGEYLRLLGVDLFSGEPFRAFPLGGAAEKGWNLERWLGSPRTVALSADFAQKHGLKAGDILQALVNGTRQPLTILTLLDVGDSPAAGQARLAVMDIGWAQELLGKAGHLSAVQLLVKEPGRAETVAAELNRWLPAHLHAEPPRQRSTQLQNMVGAFQLNLSALSLVSLLVGVFLVYNTISATVTRRRREIGILRALGATRGEVRALFLGEACLFGIGGIALGGAAGVALAQGLAGAVAQTISSLYVLLSIERALPTTAQCVTAAALGFGAVLAGAWLPASEAARIEPVRALSLGTRAERSAEQAAWWPIAALGCLLMSLAAAVLALRTGPAWLSFGAAFGVLAGFSAFAPAATRGFGAGAAWLTRSVGVVWRMAADFLRRSTHRNAITVAALAAAVAMLTGLTVMIFSFRQSVNAWIERGIVADLFIAPASNEIVGLGATVPPDAITWLRARPEVASVDTFREQTVRVGRDAASSQDALLAVVAGQYRHNLSFAGGGAEGKAARVFSEEGAVAVTESFARRFHVVEGQPLTLLTPRGAQTFPIAGIYSDFTRDQGVVLMDRRTFDRFWDAPEVQSLAVYLAPGAGWEALTDAFRAEFSWQGEFAVYSNRTLRERIFFIFDQTFAVTSVLRTVALVVAIAGVYLSVTTLVAERERDIGMLRAIGASRGQIVRLFVAESAMIGLLASALGLAAGAALAVVLTRVVNPAFFGWTVALRFPWSALAATPLWVTLAAALAAAQPAWVAARGRIAEAVRAE